MSSKLVILVSAGLLLRPSALFEGGSSKSTPSSMIIVSCRLWLYWQGPVSGTIADKTITIFYSGSTVSWGGEKRSSCDRMVRNRKTLTAPERLSVERPKNIAAEGISLRLT